MLNPAASTSAASPAVWVQFWRLTKPRVVSLIVFTAVIGMLLASPGVPPMGLLVAATAGIALVAGAAAAFNCLVEHKIDAAMARTRGRPTVIGTITALQILLFSGGVGGLGLAILWHAVNPLTMWLTLGTFVGYAIIYTVILKPATPQNIVIGGASGAMPPLLGWAAITGDVTFQPLCSSSSSSRGRRRTSGRSRSTAATSTRVPASRCCRSRTARRSLACTCCSTRCCSWRRHSCRSRRAWRDSSTWDRRWCSTASSSATR
jgi:hypothetical protein